ncbi:hypothetical protein IAT38_006247 [Cryptococcus sp. DSM 104549]
MADLVNFMDMGGMDHSSSSSSNSTTAAACQISMLFNYKTIDACFLSSSWHIRSQAMFGGTCFGILLLCVLVEFLRRAGRDLDRWLVKRAQQGGAGGGVLVGGLGKDGEGEETVRTVVRPAGQYVPPWPHHLLRSLVYGSQFTLAFLIMLIGMYFNVIILICIFLGQTIGYFLFARDTCQGGVDCVTSGSCC